MPSFANCGKALMLLGILLFIAGVVIYGSGRFFNFGHLPGDIVLSKGNFTFYFPVVSSIVLSVILSVLLRLIRR